MRPEKEHHHLVRLSTTDHAARIRADDGLELMGGPTFDDWRGDWWLSEELLVSAVEVSLLSSFLAQAKEERLPVGAFRCVGEAIVHEGEERPLSRLVLRIELEAASEDLVRAEQVLHRAKEACVMGKALTIAIELQVTAIPSGASLETP